MTLDYTKLAYAREVYLLAEHQRRYILNRTSPERMAIAHHPDGTVDHRASVTTWNADAVKYFEFADRVRDLWLRAVGILCVFDADDAEIERLLDAIVAVVTEWNEPLLGPDKENA